MLIVAIIILLIVGFVVAFLVGVPIAGLAVYSQRWAKKQAHHIALR
jgi:ABC-type antimicrobial peptide transport system permease subunit